MNQNLLSSLNTDKPTETARYRWLPILSIQPGMVTARPVVGRTGIRETMFVAAGATISLATIEQMVAKGVECVAVTEGQADITVPGDSRVSDYKNRLIQIFGPTPNEACQPVLDALLAAAEVLC
jgi:hypothetical protein